jgi:hypothetical protein
MMARIAIGVAAVAALLAVLPGGALFWGMSAAIVAIATGWAAYRERGAPGGRRVWGAVASLVGGVALLVCLVRYGLILVALERLEGMLG